MSGASMHPWNLFGRPTARAVRTCKLLWIGGGWLFSILCGLAATDFPKPFNTQEETIPLLTPTEALARIQLPEGFHATLFAGEPDVQQPIGMTTDARGRLWVAENYTYSENAVNFHPTLQDRIVILEDRDQDGHFDHRTVFWDQARKLTSVAVGFGGVFALCPPKLLFIPDRNGDDVPDGEPEVLLDGWSDGTIRHTIVNGLKWGPDGWLYGRHGIQATSWVGKPGTPENQRTPINVGLWRYHPITHAFEVVAQGTTNPWGHDWDDYGELFFINTVIGHLWHVVPGAYYKRMYGEHSNPYLYDLIDQTADHFHWDTRELWHDIRKLGVTPTTSTAGGGHAHCGLMIYLGDNWPSSYRNSVFAVNYHGKRLNNDILERQGAGYVAHHGRDFMTSGDPWFRGIDLLYGPDGGVFVSDWSDIGECHDHDGIHRTSGRIYKVVYDKPKKTEVRDLHTLDNAALIELQLHPNDWYVRQARLILQERFAAGIDMKDLHPVLMRKFTESQDVTRKLRFLWALAVTGGANDEWLRSVVHQSNEHLKVWALQLLMEKGHPSAAWMAELESLSKNESSGLVLAYLAGLSQKLPPADRWALLEAIAKRQDFATDRTLPLLSWYGLQPAILASSQRALQLCESSTMPHLRKNVARYLAEDWENHGSELAAFVQIMARHPNSTIQSDILQGWTEALRGRRHATPPSGWETLQSQLMNSVSTSVKQWSRELAVVFGDGRAVSELSRVVGDTKAEIGSRRQAISSLVQTRSEGLTSLLKPLLQETDIAPDAIRAMASLGDPQTPALLLKEYPALRTSTARSEAISALCSRPMFAKALLQAVSEHQLRSQEVGPLHVRQLSNLGDPEVEKETRRLWPEYRPLSTEKKKLLEQYRKRLSPEALAHADVQAGHKLFQAACASCHTLFGEGGKIAPDLTGSDRRNLDYLLDNILDPSGVVPENYRMSVVTTKDGRVINGLVGTKTERMLQIQTPTEKIALEQSDIENIKRSELSMMPDGLLESLTEVQVRDLVAYLRSDAPIQNQ